MDGFDLKVDTSQWEALLLELPKRVAKTAVRKALQAGGDVLCDAMKDECPVRTDEATPGSDALEQGLLQESITTQVMIGTKYDPKVKIGPGVGTGHVAYWVENGFDHIEGGKRGKGGRVTKHVDANPFMQRAFDSAIGVATDALLESLGRSLGQDTGGLHEGQGADNDFDYGDD
jgi:hypothetical protein